MSRCSTAAARTHPIAIMFAITRSIWRLKLALVHLAGCFSEATFFRDLRNTSSGVKGRPDSSVTSAPARSILRTPPRPTQYDTSCPSIVPVSRQTRLGNDPTGAVGSTFTANETVGSSAVKLQPDLP